MTATINVRLGKVVATPGALEALTLAGTTAIPYLRRHVQGDWGDLSPEDVKANNDALNCHERLLSAYHLPDKTKIWIITEADRSSTCILLPSEY